MGPLVESRQRVPSRTGALDVFDDSESAWFVSFRWAWKTKRSSRLSLFTREHSPSMLLPMFA